MTRVFVDAYVDHGCNDSGSMTAADVLGALPAFAREHARAGLASALDDLVDGGILRRRSMVSDRYELTPGLRARLITRNGLDLLWKDRVPDRPDPRGAVVGEIPRVIAEHVLDLAD